VGLTDTEFCPVPPSRAVPPQLPVNQSVVKPVPGSVTEIVDEEPEQMGFGDALIPAGDDGRALTVTVTVEQEETHPVDVFRVRA